MAAKMAAIMDFTKNSNLPGKCLMQICFARFVQCEIELNILLLLVAFYVFFFFTKKTGKKTHFYLVTMATDRRHTLLKCVLRITEELLKTAYASNKCG